MANKFKLNRAGVGELLKSSEMGAVCKEYADVIQSRCGNEGYESNVMVGKNRVRASVYAGTVEARRDNLENNTLLKAVGR